jgi:hypothetical protein
MHACMLPRLARAARSPAPHTHTRHTTWAIVVIVSPHHTSAAGVPLLPARQVRLWGEVPLPAQQAGLERARPAGSPQVRSRAGGRVCARVAALCCVWRRCVTLRTREPVLPLHTPTTTPGTCHHNTGITPSHTHTHTHTHSSYRAPPGVSKPPSSSGGGGGGSSGAAAAAAGAGGAPNWDDFMTPGQWCVCVCVCVHVTTLHCSRHCIAVAGAQGAACS